MNSQQPVAVIEAQTAIATEPAPAVPSSVPATADMAIQASEEEPAADGYTGQNLEYPADWGNPKVIPKA